MKDIASSGFELPHLRIVHFLIYGIIEGGIGSSTDKLDGLAKSFGEFTRTSRQYYVAS